MAEHTHTDDARWLALLERWSQGDFTRREEEELYALSAADPFRREALEGFLSLPEADHTARMALLRKNLRQRSGGASGRAVWIRWSAVAAALLLLLVARYFLPSANKQTEEIAQTSPPPLASPTPADTNFPQANGPLASATSPRSPIQSTGPAIEARDAVRTLPVYEDKELLVLEEKAAAKDTLAMPVAAEPPAPAVAAKADEAPSDQAIAYKPESDDAEAAPPPVGSNKPVETEARQEAPAKASKQKKASDYGAGKLGPTPVNGWSGLNAYFREKARLPQAARNNNVSGYVRLRFNIGEGGRPYDIRVIRGLGFGCDEEAVRLVGDTQWFPGGDNEVELSIPFIK